MRLTEKPRFVDRRAVENFRCRERETLRHNSRVLDESIAREEQEVDALIGRLRPWSDKWVAAMNKANALRRRRIALLPNMVGPES